jgi:superoxide reductase
MTALNQIYKCNVCGNMVEVVHASVGELVCCNQPMQLLEAQTKDQGQEKHVPVVEKTESGIKVKVGEVPHPMEEEHYVEWIEVVVGTKNYRKYLVPGESAIAEFPVTGEVTSVKEFCNVHGLWKA